LNFTALKNTITEIIPEGYEPYSEFRPEEEISTCIAENSILNRMTFSILYTVLGNKDIVELKRALEAIWIDNLKLVDKRKKIEDLIQRFFKAMDRTGENAKHYKEMFESMTDTGFKSYFDGFFRDKKAYLVLNVADYKHNLSMDEIEDAAKVLNIPLFEYVFMPHMTLDKKNVLVSRMKVPVGYLVIKRTQQTLKQVRN
jgi:hypothetical protein